MSCIIPSKGPWSIYPGGHVTALQIFTNWVHNCFILTRQPKKPHLQGKAMDLVPSYFTCCIVLSLEQH